MKGKTLRLVLGGAISGLCLYLVFRKVPFAEFRQALREASYIWFLPATVIYVLGLFLRSVKWQAIFHAIKPVPVAKIFPYLMLGFYTNTLLPVRVGELVRAFYAGRKFGVGTMAAFGTVVLDRLVEVAAALTWAFAVSLAIPCIPAIPLFGVKLNASLFLRFSVVALVGVFAMLYGVSHGRQRISQKLAAFPRVAGWWANFSGGLAALRSKRILTTAYPVAVLVWFCDILTIQCAMRAFGIYMNVWEAGFLLVLFLIGVSLPSAPGFIGPFEAAGVVGMGLLADAQLIAPVAGATASAAVLTLHLFQIALVLIIGTWVLFREGLSFHQLDISSSSGAGSA